MSYKFSVLSALIVGAVLAGCAKQSNEIVVYSARNESLIRPIFERYTAETGVPVQFVTDSAGALMERLKAEGANGPADVLLTVDAGNLWQAGQSGLLQTTSSETLRSNIPEHLRDPNEQWFGLSVRARTIAYHTGRVDVTNLSTYEDLGSSVWRGRLCLRTSKKVYNQSLVAMLLTAHGESATEDIVSGWVENLATEVFSSDTQVLEAIAAGQCDVGVVNSYYYGRLLRENPELPLALFWPNQAGGGGVHVNVAGAGITAHASHAREAIDLLEWLSSSVAQELFASANLEYPANPDVEVDPVVKAWGVFEPSRMNLANAGLRQADAVRLMDRIGYK